VSPAGGRAGQKKTLGPSTRRSICGARTRMLLWPCLPVARGSSRHDFGFSCQDVIWMHASPPLLQLGAPATQVCTCGASRATARVKCRHAGAGIACKWAGPCPPPEKADLSARHAAPSINTHTHTHTLDAPSRVPMCCQALVCGSWRQAQSTRWR